MGSIQALGRVGRGQRVRWLQHASGQEGGPRSSPETLQCENVEGFGCDLVPGAGTGRRVTDMQGLARVRRYGLVGRSHERGVASVGL